MTTLRAHLGEGTELGAILEGSLLPRGNQRRARKVYIVMKSQLHRGKISVCYPQRGGFEHQDIDYNKHLNDSEPNSEKHEKSIEEIKKIYHQRACMDMQRAAEEHKERHGLRR